MTKLAAYEAYCDARKLSHQWRDLTETQILPGGRLIRSGATFVNFASNDYLGLSQHPTLKERACAFASAYGTGATASRLITGNAPSYRSIEDRVANAKGTETALIMNSGYQANLSVIEAIADPAVAGKPVVILADRLCHSSLLQGALLSGARLIRFHHNDYAHLGGMLATHSEKHMIIVSESVFGMDGDRADIDTLVALSKKHRALLYIDEAHATGLYGADGFGFCAARNGDVDIVMGTFGKALGSFGAYVACRHEMRDYLIQRCGGLIYSTALPPQILGALDAAIDMIPKMGPEREHLAVQSRRLRAALIDQSWNCGASTTHIIPVILGSENAALALGTHLEKNGIVAAAIRPPTVPRGTSRMRFSVSAAHAPSDIDHLIDVMRSTGSLFKSAA